jgi:hypothetical protein
MKGKVTGLSTPWEERKGSEIHGEKSSETA